MIPTKVVRIDSLLKDYKALDDFNSEIRNLIISHKDTSREGGLSRKYNPVLGIVDLLDLNTLSQGILAVHGSEWFLPLISDQDFSKQNYSGIILASELISRGLNLAFEQENMHLQAVPRVYGLQGASFGLVGRPEYGIGVSRLVRRSE